MMGLMMTDEIESRIRKLRAQRDSLHKAKVICLLMAMASPVLLAAFLMTADYFMWMFD